MSNTLHVGSRRELFVDHTLIERFYGDASLKLHTPNREEVVFTVEGPHENGASGVYSVLLEHEGRHLLYYRGNYPLKGSDHSGDQTANVAVSEDGGRTFTRPELGIIDLGDGGKNNAIWQGIQSHNFVPVKDPRPDCPDNERFKAVGGTGKNNLYALFSADGIHWRLIQDEPLDIAGAFDSANVPLWDPVIEKFRLFSRHFEKTDGFAGRAIQSCTSDDFIHWTTPEPHTYDSCVPREEFYTNATVCCPGAEHLLLSFPMRYNRNRTTPIEDTSAMEYPGRVENPAMTGITDAVMMSSRDGLHWHRPFPEAWVRAGHDERNWTHRNNTPAIGIIAEPESWSMFISEHYGWPDNRLRRYSIRPWGFASVHGRYFGGDMITKPFTFEGSELRVNFATSAVGSVAIELLDFNFNPIEYHTLADFAPLYGDRLDHPVTWANGSDVSKLAGQPIRMRIHVADADVFSFRFA